MTMNEPTQTWILRASEAIREAAGDEGARTSEAEWKALDAVDRPMVTVFGPYDSGKSTLLKRLLVDAGVDVPSWLTVSARRETFEIKEVDALGCRFRDTPGISGGNTEHEQLAREAVTLSDVILLVVPPQLLTGDREVVLSVLSGETFRRGGLSMARAVLTVIAKLDEGSVDPTDDRGGYDDYVDRKRTEWAHLLEAAGVDLGGGMVFTVAADPFQRVGNAASPSRSDYREEYRDWDGMEVLASALQHLSGKLKSLRVASHQRFLCSRMEALRQAAESRGTDVKFARDVAKDNRERFALLKQQLNALMSAARASLNGAVEEELVTAARSRVESSDAIDAFLVPRMNKAIGRWWDDQTALLQNLIDEAEAQVETRTHSTGAAKARRVLNADGENGNRQKRTSPLRDKKLASIFNKAEAILKDHHEQQLGMKLSKARAELKKLQQAKSFTEYVKAAGRRKSFKTLEEAKKAKGIVGFHVIADTVAPAVLELGALIWDELQRRSVEKERATRRAALREALRMEAIKIADGAWKEWRVSSDEFLAWIKLHADAAATTEEALAEELVMIEAATAKLRKALD
jgi:hypothetical protein